MGFNSDINAIDKEIIKYSKSRKEKAKLELNRLIRIKEIKKLIEGTFSYLNKKGNKKGKEKEKEKIQNHYNDNDDFKDSIIFEYRDKNININENEEDFKIKYSKKPILKVNSKDKSELDKIKEVYNDFVLNFRIKNFLKCKDYISNEDLEYIKKELEFNDLNISFDSFVELNIKNIWEAYFENSFRGDIISNLKKNFNLYLSDMKEKINHLKKQNNIDEIKETEEEIEYETKKLKSEICFLKATVEPFGEIFDYFISDNRAILSVNLRYNFVDIEEHNNIKDIISIQNLKIVNFVAPNILNVYDTVFFIKDKKNDAWKISFFSHEMFFDGNGKFDNFLNKYKN